MASLAFQPLGEQPLWRSVFDHVAPLDYGEVVTYQKLTELVERDVLTNRAPIYAASKHLEQEAHKTLECVPNVGYRVAMPEDHLRIAQKHRVSANRKVRKGLRVARSTNRSLVGKETADRLDAYELNLGRVEQQLRHVSKRVAVVEGKTDIQAQQQQKFVKQLADLQKAMADAGIKVEAA